MIKLYQLSYSPWSEKARWALDSAQLSYQPLEFDPIYGWITLRVRTANLKEPLTVPVMIDGATKLTDSFDIAMWSQDQSPQSKLMPADKLEQIKQWNKLSEEGLCAARAICVSKAANNKAAKTESVPAIIPSWARPYATPLVSRALNQLAHKYQFPLDESNQAAHQTLERVLEQLAQALEGGKPYILGEFSYADIVMATSLQFIKPVADEYIALGEATRACMTIPELAYRYAALIEWRDGLYEKHRKH